MGVEMENLGILSQKWAVGFLKMGFWELKLGDLVTKWGLGP